MLGLTQDSTTAATAVVAMQLFDVVEIFYDDRARIAEISSLNAQCMSQAQSVANKNIPPTFSDS